MKLNYVKRTCKSNRQELLNIALGEVMEEMRKKYFHIKDMIYYWMMLKLKRENFGEKKT